VSGGCVCAYERPRAAKHSNRDVEEPPSQKQSHAACVIVFYFLLLFTALCFR
jgi:hypothetical protein